MAILGGRHHGRPASNAGGSRPLRAAALSIAPGKQIRRQVRSAQGCRRAVRDDVSGSGERKAPGDEVTLLAPDAVGLRFSSFRSAPARALGFIVPIHLRAMYTDKMCKRAEQRDCLEAQ